MKIRNYIADGMELCDPCDPSNPTCESGLVCSPISYTCECPSNKVQIGDECCKYNYVIYCLKNIYNK